jgi:hypothetical protein
MFATMTACISPDESYSRLHAAGWSVGETTTATGWLVIGYNGGIVIKRQSA